MVLFVQDMYDMWRGGCTKNTAGEGRGGGGYPISFMASCMSVVVRP